MPKTVPDTGLGATISGTGLITTEITRISEMTISVDAMDVTHLGTQNYRRMRPGDLRVLPEVEIEFNWLGNTPPIGTAMVPTTEPYAGSSVTITYPEGGGSVSGSAFVKSVKFPNAAPGEIMKGSYVVQFDGATQPAFGTN